MTAMPYRLLVMMTDDNTHTVESLAQALVNALPDGVRVEHTAAVVRVVTDDWVYVFGHSDAAHVQDESREIANMFGRSIDEKMQIGACKRRLEGGGSPDPDGTHATTFKQILQALKNIPHLIVFDVVEPKIVANTVPEGT